MKTLSWIRQDGIDLEQALREYAGKLGAPGVALAYTPARCLVAAVAGSALSVRSGEVPVDEIFELRAFGRDAELRWLHEDAGLGRAVILTEDGALLRGLEGEPGAIDYLERLDNTYLLWGTALEEDCDGWTTLAEARVGAIEIPLADVSRDDRAWLHSFEYLAADPEHGNVSVVEERLVGFGGAR